MPVISNKKIKKIKEDILSTLFDSPLNPLFTSQVAENIARDEEFTLRLLKELHSSKMVDKIDKNTVGKTFLKRKRWTLKPEVYSAYKSLSKH